MKVIYFIIYLKDQDKPNYGLCFNFCDTLLNYSDLRPVPVTSYILRNPWAVPSQHYDRPTTVLITFLAS